jgi:RNA polymerase sigma-70 factor, ECF subfamily
MLSRFPAALVGLPGGSATRTVSNVLELETAKVQKAKAGDRAAFHALYLENRDNVARLVFRMGIGKGDLDDLVQDVFIQVFRSLKDFRGQSKFSTWVHKVAVNVVLMHRRAQRVRPNLDTEIPEGQKARDAGPDDETERHRRMQAFARILSQLSDKKRDVFVLHDLEGMSPAEISEAVQAPVLTVRTRLFYARRELDALMQKEPLLLEVSTMLADRDVNAGGAK